MDTIFQGLKSVERWVLTPIFVASIYFAFSLAITEVVLRYIWGQSIVWQADVVVYTILTATFLHFGVTERANSHLRMTVLFEAVSKRFRVAAGIIRGLANIAALIYLGLFIYHGVGMTLFGRELGRMVQSRAFPVWPFYGLMVVGHLLLAAWIGYRLYVDTRALIRGEPYSEELLGGDEDLMAEDKIRA